MCCCRYDVSLQTYDMIFKKVMKARHAMVVCQIFGHGKVVVAWYALVVCQVLGHGKVLIIWDALVVYHIWLNMPTSNIATGS